MLTSCYMLTSWVSLLQGNVKKPEKLMKIVNIDGENLHIFWTTRGISMKFPGKLWLIIILKVSKNQGFIFSLEDTFLKKLPEGGSTWPPPAL